MQSRPLFEFRLAGIPVLVQPLYALILGASAFLYRNVTMALLWVAVVTVSILWHELGHALAQRRFGYPPWIELVAMGGLTHWPAGADPSARQALVVSAAGPGAGLLLGAAAWGLSRATGPLPFVAGMALQLTIWVNVVWSLFNLLPILPLDGSRVLDHISRLVTGRREPRWVGWLSLLTGGAGALFGVARQNMLLAIIGGMGAVMGYQRVRLGQAGGRAAAPARSPLPARKKPRRSLVRGGAEVRMLEARAGALSEWDLAEQVGVLIRLGREDQLVELCRERLTAFARRADAEPLARLAAEALAEEGAHEQALEVAQLAYRQLHIPYHAYDAACHLVRLGRLDEAVRWIETALEAGLDAPGMLMTDPALEPLRERDDFLAAVARSAGRPGTG
jgi:Zn-dependent protease